MNSVKCLTFLLLTRAFCSSLSEKKNKPMTKSLMKMKMTLTMRKKISARNLESKKRKKAKKEAKVLMERSRARLQTFKIFIAMILVSYNYIK